MAFQNEFPTTLSARGIAVIGISYGSPGANHGAQYLQAMPLQNGVVQTTDQTVSNGSGGVVYQATATNLLSSSVTISWFGGGLT